MKFIAFIFVSFQLFTAQPSNAGPTENLNLVGEAKLTVFFWDIYQASLYNLAGSYQYNVYPQALRINYLRDIKSQELVEQTQQEWQKLQLPTEQTDKWLILLADIFPDIRDGDNLLVHVDKTKRSTFYYNEKIIGEIIDPDFAYPFFRIWLDKKCSYPKVCQKLRGEE